MTRTDLLKIAKPILFNTDMVRAILDGRKAVTRRLVKSHGNSPQYYGREKFYTFVDKLNGKTGVWAGFYKDSDIFYIDGIQHTDAIYFKLPYKVNDILYVRETWCEVPYEYEHIPIKGGYITIPKIAYKADSSTDYTGIWRPSIHMPKETARIFLRVTDVRVERLQDITAEQIDAEGCKEYGYNAKTGKLMPSRPTWFKIIWDNTIKKQDLDKYGWEANPWVWVYEFERVECDEVN